MADIAHPYDRLDPALVLDAVETLGLCTDGRLFALNSYENRVYRVGLESPLAEGLAPGVVPDQCVVKFYRPGRWSDAQIREEHDFGRELAQADLPVAAPLFRDGGSLFEHGGFRFAVFECRRGAAPELDAPGARALLGRTLGRLHAIGGRQRFRHRESIDAARCGARARESVLAADVMPDALARRYDEVSAQVVDAVRAAFDAAGPLRYRRLHGDCHLGNLLWDASGPVFVDLDDCIEGPAIQDLWMLCAGGNSDAARAEWLALLEGYETFALFDGAETTLVEALRAMRMLAHSAWLTARWSDPAFPRAFPWFAGTRYWERQVEDLGEQMEALQGPSTQRSW